MGVAFEGEDGIGGGEGIELAFADGLGDGFKFFAIKVVFLTTNRAYAPKIKELRAVALA